MLLLTSEAIYIPTESKVILNNNVKMYDESDSLECQHLILYEKEYKNLIGWVLNKREDKMDQILIEIS